jgi:hypothetical protein
VTTRRHFTVPPAITDPPKVTVKNTAANAKCQSSVRRVGEIAVRCDGEAHWRGAGFREEVYLCVTVRPDFV